MWLDSIATSEFTCDDGSGTFTTESTYRATISGGSSSFEGTWEWLAGTEAYASVQGGGTFEGDCTPLASGCENEGIGVITS